MDQPEETHRGGLVFGMLLGTILLAGAALWLFAARPHHGRPNESSAIATLRTLVTAQALYRDADKNANGVPDCARSLGDLGAANLIDSVVRTGRKSGYVFTLSGAGTHWSATAVPEVPGRTGNRCFFVDESNTIRFSVASPAGPTSTPVGQ